MSRLTLRPALFCAAIYGTICNLGIAEDWPAFRGPNGDGTTAESGVPSQWDSEKNVKWKVTLPSAGNASPIVSGGKVFVTCAADEGRKRSLYCFDRSTGGLRWEQTVDFDRVMPTHQTNPYGGSTPVANGERVVVWHSSAGLYCYDFEGRELWHRNLGEFRHMWGYGSSPILHQGRIILHSGPGEQVFVTSIDLESGKTLWKTDEPLEGAERNNNGKYLGSWSTPLIAHVENRELIVCSLPTRVNAYDPATGEIVWSCDGLRGKDGDLAYTSPLIVGDICVSMGGFKGPAIGFRMHGHGNITEKQRLWRVENNPQRIGSGVVVDQRIYMANAGRNTFQCIEPETGNILWEERNDGAAHWGSLVFADGRIYGTDQDGTTHVLKPNPERFERVAKNEINEHCNATPAISDGQIFLRTFEHLYCIGR